MIDRLEFAAPFVYSTKGTSPVSIKSQELRRNIKAQNERLFGQIAEHVAGLSRDGLFADFFGPDVTLVPVPGHAPLAPGARGATDRIAQALQRHRLAGDVRLLLARKLPVAKSAFSTPANRPRARDHFKSMEVIPSLLAPKRVLLIDDFVTRGATLVGAASRILAAYPSLEVKAFALVRSITDEEIAAIRRPCVGTIELTEDGETSRRP